MPIPRIPHLLRAQPVCCLRHALTSVSRIAHAYEPVLQQTQACVGVGGGGGASICLFVGRVGGVGEGRDATGIAHGAR
jgi:hypothetical protein